MYQDSMEKTKWPFMFMVDESGRHRRWLILHAPITSPSRKQMFADYRKRGFGFIGMCSFMEFPRNESPQYFSYDSVCEGWCHCFREPDHFLPPNAPRVLLSLSDFADSCQITGYSHSESVLIDQPPFDFVYVGADQAWKMQAKNWSLAQICIPRLCHELGLRALVIGVPPGSLAGIRGVTVWPWMSYEVFLSVVSRCRFTFVPNGPDASPRILAESLCLDVPVLVNRSIVGGWKYVNSQTGVFFSDEYDVVEKAEKCLRETLQPRTWYQLHAGAQTFGPRFLRSFVGSITSAFDGCSVLGVSYEAAGL